MKLFAHIIAALAGLAPIAVAALALELPAGAIQTSDVSRQNGSVEIPIGVFANGIVPMQSASGTITSQAWKITTDALTTLQIMAPLREQLIDDGYEIVVDCETDQCGGFDFRFEINVIPDPDMHVDLGDFRYLSARRAKLDQKPEYVFLIVSRGGSSGFVQVTRVGKPADAPAVIIASTKSTEPGLVRTSLPEGEIEKLLTTVGRAPLEDLTFLTGSSRLGNDRFASLAELASYLNANPKISVALVGHTDTQGSLANNLALSKKRAASVVQRLVQNHAISPLQLEAAGVGYLVPRASNLTESGRDQNRRVEVILTSTR